MPPGHPVPNGDTYRQHYTYGAGGIYTFKNIHVCKYTCVYVTINEKEAMK